MTTGNNKGIVICKLPKAGLGNQLFPLMKAVVFAHLNELPLIVINYHQFKPGPWIRNEKSKRHYSGFFTFQKNILAEVLDKLKVNGYNTKKQVIEPKVIKVANPSTADSYLFCRMPHYTHYFEGLAEHRPLVIQLLNEMISPKIKQCVHSLEVPAIGVHIRMGDFIKIGAEEELGKRGTLRTPVPYFIKMIQAIRLMNGAQLPVTIFSDGSRNELKELLRLPDVAMAGNNDLVDLLLLSKSKIVITSAGSTFSYWASFLSDAAVIMHPAYTGIKIRPKYLWEQLYEGAFDENNGQLIRAIKAIKV